MEDSPGFADALLAPGPHLSLGADADTYGRLIGSWSGTFDDRHPDGTSRERGSIEVHFAWALDGRAVQDVWIAPSRAGGQGRSPGLRDTFGTTLRVFDPAAGCWRVLWLNPARQVRTELVGRRVGDDIVQMGWSEDAPIKWMFSGIEPRRFRWQAFVLDADGATWRLVTEFRLERQA